MYSDSLEIVVTMGFRLKYHDISLEFTYIKYS